MKEVVTAYADKADVKQVQSTGLHISGERFVVIKADDRSLYGKKVCHDSFIRSNPRTSRRDFLVLVSFCEER